MKTTEQPLLQDFHIKGVKHIHPLDALEAIRNGEAVLLDVREINEVQKESVPLDRVINHPMSLIMERLPYIIKDQLIIVACPHGMRSAKVANLLNMEGYPTVLNLDGGLSVWKTHGLPYDTNPLPMGCGCDSVQATENEPDLSSALLKNSVKTTDFKNLRRI